jgi:hypothetical protein
MFPGRLARFARERSCERPRVPRTRIFLTTTMGPAGLYCWLDYVGGAVGGGELEVVEGWGDVGGEEEVNGSAGGAREEKLARR